MQTKTKNFLTAEKARAVLRPVISIIVALCLVAIILLALDKNPISVFASMFEGAFGTTNAIAETLLKASTLILVGLAYAFAAKCGLVNIGIEGQLYMGALGSTAAGIYLDLPMVIHIPVCFIAGFICGGIWGGIVAYFKNQFGSNEVITTVMMNYVAIYFIGFMVTGPMKDPEGVNPQTASVAESAQIPLLIEDTRLNWGFVFALLLLVVYYIYWSRTKMGYEMSVVGKNNNVGAYAGMSVKRVVMMSMVVSGGLGGMAGTLEILGNQLRLKEGFSSGFGFDGIAVALLGSNSAPGILFSSVLFGALRTGGNRIQMTEGVPSAITGIVQGLVILFVLVDFLRIRSKKASVKKGA